MSSGMFGLTAMLMGPWLERQGPRRGLLLGSSMFGVGQAVASLSLYKKSIVGVYIGYGVLGGFGLGLNYISPVSALQKFFPDYRGVASGFAVAGFGAGSIVWSKVYIPLMNRYKLPETFAILGAILSGTMLASAIVMRTPPNAFTAGGLTVSGEKIYKDDPNKLQFEEPSADVPTHATNIPSGHHVVPGTSSTPIAMTLIQSIFSTDYGFMYLMFFANQLFGLVALSRLANMAEDLFGKSATQASTVVSINGVFNCLGRIFLPMCADLAIKTLRVIPPFARKVIFYISLVAQIIIVAILSHLINTHNYNGFRAVMWTLTFFYGGGFGTIPCFLTDMFGPYNIGALHGMILTAWSIGGVGGGLGFTHLFDKHKPSAARANVAGAYNEAYESNFKWILAVLIVGLVMTFFVRTDHVDRTSPGWRYSVFGKKVVHFKRKDSTHGRVVSHQNGTPPRVVEDL